MLYLRNQPVDIARYLPSFLQSDKRFQSLLQACSTEHEKYRLFLDELSNQFFVETATWGLTDWERILDLRPDAGDNYEQRRNRILLKLQSHNTSTLEFMAALIKRYCKAGTDVTIYENETPYTFRIDVSNGSVLYSRDLLDALETYKPAHLSYRIALHWLTEMTEDESIKYGLVDVVYGKRAIQIPTPPEIEKKLWSGVAYTCIGRKSADIARPDVFTARRTVGMYQIRTGYISIGGIK